MAVPTPRAAGAREALELLSADLLDENRETVERFRALASKLNMGFGWHYLLDLVWILRMADPAPGSTVLDAGAGTGLIQWYLAREGCHVLSVDRVSRSTLEARYRARFPVRGLRPSDLEQPVAPPPAPSEPAADGHRGGPLNWRSVLRRLGERPPQADAAVARPAPVPTAVASDIGLVDGNVVIYNQDLGDLVDIPDDSIDGIVSVSSLEHNDRDKLPVVVGELMRVLKPGGRLVATLGASGGEDWFHEPSKGWCYSEATLRRVFGIPASVASNYRDYDRILAEIRENAELRDGLSPVYFRSGDNGMPWGRWDPQYLSVGVCVVKGAQESAS